MGIKVLHIIKSLGRGGAEMLLAETLKMHDRTKFEFHFAYFLPWKDQMVNDLVSQGGLVHCFSARNNFELLFKTPAIVEYVRRNNIQVIHAHLPWAGIVARLTGMITRLPVVYTEHNKQERYHPVTRLVNLFTMNWQTLVVAVSEDVMTSIRRNKPGLKVPSQVIPNGVNTSYFCRSGASVVAAREELKIPVNAPVVGTVAVFRSQKRLDLWMDLAMEILKLREKVHFVLVGDGPLRESLVRRRESMGLEGRIHMPGLKTDVRPYLAAMDIYMMTSIFEGMPVALLEAMAMECAVVSTNAGGVKEVVRHDVDGLLCPVDETPRMVSMVCSLIDDSTRRSRMAGEARRRVEDKFGIRVMVSILSNHYERLGGMTNSTAHR